MENEIRWKGGKLLLKQILNIPEQITYRRLHVVCTRWKALVYAKVRLADVLPIESSGIPSELYDFALTAHYDFVITDKDQCPLFAVEFDGPQHRLSEQAERDARKNELSRRFELLLFRVESRDLFRTESRLDRLTELTDRWFERNDAKPDRVSGERVHSTGLRNGQRVDIKMKSFCPQCQADMVMKHGKYGPFLSCIRYPECKGACDLPNPAVKLPTDPPLASDPKPVLGYHQKLTIGIATGFLVLSLVVVVFCGPRTAETRKIKRSSYEVRPTIPIGDPDDATDRQLNLLDVLTRRRGWSESERDTEAEIVLGYRREYKKLSKKEASKLITAWDDRKN